MGGIALKETPENHLKPVSKEKLLADIERMTSKEVSEACGHINDEKLVERVRLMCERLASSANPSAAVVTIANLSYTHGRQELVKVMEDLENIPKKMLASSLEILHDVNVRNSIMLRLHRTRKIDEIGFARALSEFANTADVTRFEQGMLLTKSCIAWDAQPDKLYEIMTKFLKKNPTISQLNEEWKGLKELTPLLRREFEFRGKPVEDSVITRRPEDTLLYLAEKAGSLAPADFLKVLKDTVRDRSKGKALNNFEAEVIDGVEMAHAGFVAIALRMCDNPEFYGMVSKAFYMREERGYKPDSLPPIRYPTAVLQRIHSSSGEPCGIDFVDDRPKNTGSTRVDFIDLLQDKPTGIITPSMHADGFKELKEIRYSDLQKIANSSRAVKNELAALDHLISQHPEELGREMALGTAYMDILDEEAGEFLNLLLRTVHEKKLYGDDFGMADIGTGSGKFTEKPVSYILENIKNPRIVRTNPTGLGIEAHKEMEVRIHDITDGPIGEKFDLVIIKDIMKFFTPEGKARIWENVAQDVKEGGFVLSGGVGTFKLHVKYNGELVKVNPERFIGEVGGVNDYGDYVGRLGGMVKRSGYIEAG